MRRKDGQPKTKARRNLPVFAHGLKGSPQWDADVSSDGDSFSVMSFFSGCGGLDLGFRGGFHVFGQHYPQLPFQVLDAYDNLQDAVDCYRLNLDSEIHFADLTQPHTFRDADVLIGGFPCQDFSSAGPKTGFDGKRGGLYKVMLNYMLEHQPRVVVAENVSYLSKLRDGNCLKTILADFESAGYHFDLWELRAQDYGVPQNRQRLFFIGVRNDIEGFPVKPQPTTPLRPRTISEAISDLEAISDESVTNQSQYFVSTRATSGGGQGDNVNVPDRVAYCIRANARGRIQFHYRLDRRLTVRECARIQTFPDEFVFPFTTQRNLTLIGNAVPPILGFAIARSIADFLMCLKKIRPHLHLSSFASILCNHE